MPLPTRVDVHADVTQIEYTYEYQEVAGGAWQTLTPNSGVSERGASDGSDPAFVLITSAGASGGVFYRATPSAAWVLRNTGLPTDATWRWVELAINPRNQDDWLLLGATTPDNLTRSGGNVLGSATDSILWRTTDAGITWQSITVPEPATAGTLRIRRRYASYTDNGTPIIVLDVANVNERVALYAVGATSATIRAEFATGAGAIDTVGVLGGVSGDAIILTGGTTRQWHYVTSGGAVTSYPIGTPIGPGADLARRFGSREFVIFDDGGDLIVSVPDYRFSSVTVNAGLGVNYARIAAGADNYYLINTGSFSIWRLASTFTSTTVADTTVNATSAIGADSRDNQYLAALTSGAIAYSVDNGVTWQEITRPTTSLTIASYIGVINAPVSLDGIIDHNISLDVAGNSALTVPFVGTAAETRMRITGIAPRDVFAWRVTANWPSGESVIGVGFVDSITEDDGYSIAYDCSCASAVIRRVALYSDLFVQRRAATKTTSSSIEDPTDPDYAGGLINWILWQTGGRPSAQAGLYPNATYYYACDHSDIVLPHGWVAADDSWAELGRIVAAVGGWLYQTPDGVMTYKATSAIVGQGETVDVVYIDQPTTVADRENGDITVTAYQATTPKEAAPRTVTANYVIRAVAYQAEVYRDTTPIVLQASATHAAVIETQQPLDTREPISVMIEAVRLRGGSLLNDTQVTQSSVFTSAQRITLTITNTLTEPIVITGITVEAAPLVIVDEGASAITTAVASGYDLRLGDLTLIGSRNRTRQLVEYVAAVVGSASARATAITLPDLRLDPERVIGERVGILLEQLTLFAGTSGIAPIITGYEYDAIGGMTLRLSLIGATLNYWQYADGGISDGDTRRLFY